MESVVLINISVIITVEEHQCWTQNRLGSNASCVIYWVSKLSNYLLWL